MKISNRINFKINLMIKNLYQIMKKSLYQIMKKSLSQIFLHKNQLIKKILQQPIYKIILFLSNLNNKNLLFKNIQIIFKIINKINVQLILIPYKYNIIIKKYINLFHNLENLNKTI